MQRIKIAGEISVHSDMQMLLLLLSRFSRVLFFATPWTAAYQVPPSWDFPGKSTGVGCHCLLQRYADDTTLMAENEEELKSLLMKVKEESEKAGL